MGGINAGKLLVAGIVTGLVINIGQSVVHLFLFAEQSAALTEGMGLSEPTGSQIGMYWVLAFLIGIGTMFVYAGFRPRFGAGPGPAMLAGGTVFVLGELIPSHFWIASGAMTFADYAPFLVATLVILLLAAPAGAYFYGEDGAAD